MTIFIRSFLSLTLLLVPLSAFALFDKKSTATGVWAGAICGVATAVLIAFSGPIFGADPETGLDPISFQWISPFALVVNIAVGMLVSRLTSKENPQPTTE